MKRSPFGSVFTWLALLSLLVISSCKKKELSETAKKLIANQWKYDTNANLDAGNQNLENSTGIKSNFQLGGDVKKIADFLSETLTFGEDTKNNKLAYEKKYGEGILSTSALGWWELKDNDKTLVLKEWDSQAGKEKDPIEYEIKELTSEKLVLKRKSDNTTHIYLEKKKFEQKAQEFAEKEKANQAKPIAEIPEGIDESKIKKDWKVGDKAEIYWKGQWYKGSIVEGKNAEGKFKVRYDGYDSNWDEFVDVRRLREIQGGQQVKSDEKKSQNEYKVGDKVEILWNGSWYKGSIISAKNAEGKYKIHYDGYDSNWDEFVEPKRLRALSK
ncbi:MAG: agenet domain-containing protein [Raineya sp.]|nr:hypothetical protein [Raineya sp.]MDW8296095.1 agenet domain-containing protein [Raineya sp.]